MPDPVDQTRLAIASITVAFVKALEETNPGFAENFAARLWAIYDEIREGPMSNIGAMETLQWIHELMKKK